MEEKLNKELQSTLAIGALKNKYRTSILEDVIAPAIAFRNFNSKTTVMTRDKYKERTNDFFYNLKGDSRSLYQTPFEKLSRTVFAARLKNVLKKTGKPFEGIGKMDKIGFGILHIFDSRKELKIGGMSNEVQVEAIKLSHRLQEIAKTYSATTGIYIISFVELFLPCLCKIVALF